MYDFLLCNVPKSDVYSPLIGLPILKAILTENNYKAKVLDFNIELYHCFKNIFNDVNEWVDLDYRFKNKIENKLYIDLLEKWSNSIVEHNPRFVGFTVFSTHNMYPIVAISKLVKQKNPNIKIVIGGPATKWIGGDRLIKENVIDYYVIGYGEEAILKILNNEPFVGINDGNPCRKIDLNKTPFPDFSDLEFESYSSHNVLYTYTSRGCTQNCSFCDVNDIWNGYNTREPARVLDEMKNGYAKYNIKRFELCDSLVNGHLTNMRGFCKELKSCGFNWDGMFRIRNMEDSDYDLLAESGCTLLKIGIESGNEDIRKQMRKYFSNDQIFSTLDNMKRVGIKAAMFFMTGWPNETDLNHQESLDLITEFKDKDYTNISHIRSAPLEIQRDELMDVKDTGGQLKRYERYHEMVDHIKNNNFTIMGETRLNVLVKGYEDKL